jgi:hypothetical protein
MSPNLVRWCGLAAMLGGVLGIVLTPILYYLWTTYSDVYGYYGRAYFLVLLGCIAGLAGLYAKRGSSRSVEENGGLVLTCAGLVIGLVGNILDYWGGSPGQDFTQVQVTGFGLEVIGLLLVLGGSVMLGFAYRHANVLPKLVPWLLIAAGPGGILLSFLHVPSGTMFLFCCTWVVLGYLLLTGKVVSAEQPSRVR